MIMPNELLPTPREKSQFNGDMSAYPSASMSLGLTKREHFAAVALQGMIANATTTGNRGGKHGDT